MKRGIIVVAFGVALMVVTVTAAHAFHGVISGIANVRPATTLIASKKKSGTGSSSSKADPYQRAWELCRRKYGRSNVGRVRVLSNGKVICYLRFYSPND